jgi:hypothetical protein
MAWTERYVRADAAGGGDGTTDANSGGTGAWTLAEAITSVAAGHRVNVRAGTYANTTTTRTFANAGTTTAPIWWRGFTSTAGDLDTEPTSARTPGTDQPHFTFTTGRVVVSGAYQMMTNIAITCTGAVANNALSVTGGTFKGHRLRVDNQNADVSSRALGVSSTGGNDFSACYFKATSSSDVANVTQPGTYSGCVFEGGSDGLDTSGNTAVYQCVFNNNGNAGINLTSTVMLVALNCSFYSPASAGILLGSLPASATLHLIANCIFSDCGDYGIKNTSGANTANIQRVGNLFYNNTNGTESGFGDMPSLAQQTDSSSPFTSAGTDFSLASTSNAKSKGVPGLFENQSYTSAVDIGAVQIVEPTDAEIAAAVWAYGDRQLT